MWTGVERLTQQVTQNGTIFGQLWYLTVFVFRLIVVVTIGVSVYTDEQTAFRCSTKVIGCDNVCYDRFSKISHIRYWSFQLLAVCAPTILFHFYSSQIRGRIEKMRKQEESPGEGSEKDKKRLLRRRKSIGDIKVKSVLAPDNSKLENLTTTRQIQIAYYITVILRGTVEAISLYITYRLFHFTDHTVKSSNNPFQAIFIHVPQVYRCHGENVEWACGQHMTLGDDMTGYVPCWVSRPWEKTIFMCYMNFLSLFCLMISVIELFQISGRVCVHKYSAVQRRRRQQSVSSTMFTYPAEPDEPPQSSLTTVSQDSHVDEIVDGTDKPPHYNLAVAVPLKDVDEFNGGHHRHRRHKRRRRNHDDDFVRSEGTTPFSITISSSDPETKENGKAQNKAE